jgi:AAA+ ATPase superfamily predicted ATPase
MLGRRRVGKTALLMKAEKGGKLLYLFVSRNSEAVLCSQFQQQAVESLGLQIFGTINRFCNLFEQLLIFATTTHYTLIIDEFQDLERVNPVIFSEIQNLWDKYKDQIKINFIVCGSIYPLMTKIFENEKEPLFGRLTSKITVKPFTISVLKNILKDYNSKYTAEDLLLLYAITGGVPKYVSLLMDNGAASFKTMLEFVTRIDSPFLSEGKDLLVSEFGRDYNTYFSIIQLIASGKNKQSEIDSIIGKNTGAYLANLESQYSFLVKSKPMFAKPESRNANWIIEDHFLCFWFRFIYPNQYLIEMGKLDLLKNYISSHYEQYSDLVLKNYFRQKFAEEKNITTVGNCWDSKGENEVDLIALNDFEKTATIAEIKQNPKKIDLQVLAIKASRLQKQLSQYTATLKALSLGDM